MNGFGEQLRALRARQGIRQSELADALEVSRSTVAMWECNKREPSLDMLLKLCRHLHATPGELLAPASPMSTLLPVQTRRIPLLTSGEPAQPMADAPRTDAADSESDFALRITDDSMAPTLLPGDTLYLCAGVPDADGQIAAIVREGRIAVRRLYRTGDSCTLLCDNPRIAPAIAVDPEIIGAAIACRRPLR